jgi:hypothetical protein
MEGRRAIGAEVDPATWTKAVARLRAGIQPDMLQALEAPASKPKQTDMIGEASARARAIATPGPREAE